MKHTMKLAPEPFEKIKSGEKVVELRLFDKKRQTIGLGDTIEFLREPDGEESVTVTVSGLLRYQTFTDLMSDLPASLFGGTSKEALLDEIGEFYSKEDEEKYSVLGIRFTKNS